MDKRSIIGYVLIGIVLIGYFMLNQPSAEDMARQQRYNDSIAIVLKNKELAEKAGISPATLAKMKKDGATISSDVLVKICTALNCTMDDIVEIIPKN